jgi:hypothetical protein
MIMEVSSIVRNDYVQLAVVLSGLLTLVVLLVQANRYILVPAIAVLMNGLAKTVARAKERSRSEVILSAQNSRYLMAAFMIRVAGLFNSIAALLLSSLMVITANLLHIPGYRENITIVIDISPSSVTALSAWMFFISVMFVFINVLGLAMFGRKVRSEALRIMET